MSGFVTVPGVGSSKVHIALNSADTLALAKTIATQMWPLYGFDELQVDTVPGTVTAPNGELLLVNTIPTSVNLTGKGYNFVSDQNGGNTITIGPSVSVIAGGTAGDTIFGAGGDTIAAGGGAGGSSITVVDNTPDSLKYNIVGGIGSDTINATGGGTIVGGAGANLISSANLFGETSYVLSNGADSVYATGGGNEVVSVSGANALVSVAQGSGGQASVTASGTDTIVAGGAGNTSVTASGTGNVIMSSGSGALYAALNDANDTLSAATSGPVTIDAFGSNASVAINQASTGTASVNASGSNIGVLGGGAGSLAVTVSGSGDTVSAATTGAATVDASSSPVIYGGPGDLTFIGESTGTPTIVGYAGSTENLLIGGQGAVYSNNSAITDVTSGAGQVTIFGADQGVVNIFGSQSGALFVAGAGGETVNASQATISGANGNQFWANTASGSNDVLIGGAGTDTFSAGGGHDTLTSGSGSDAFVFFKANTNGTNVTTINAFNSNDGVFLLDYGYGSSTDQVFSTAQVINGSLTLTLSDNTKIAFTGITQVSSLYGHVLTSG